jgi:polar amino acid transport system substrate-binding protein
MPTSIFFRVLLFILSLGLFFQVSAIAAEKMTICTGLKPPLVTSPEQKGFLDTLAKEVYRRIGIDLDVIILPAERVLVNANAGIEDGCLLRIAGLEKHYPNLVMVPETILDSEFVGYATQVEPAGSGWQSLAPYSVGYITGWKIFDANVQAARMIERVSTPVQLFHMLDAKRVDIVLYERWQGLYLAKQLQVKGVKTLDPPFVTKKMYMYLNNKHAALAPKVAASLAQLKADGSYQSLYDSILKPLDTN